MVAASTDLVGYSLYLDLLGPLAAGKTRHDFDLGKEEARVRHAMELAGEGRTWRWSVQAMPASTPWRRWCSN
jgi:cobalt-precorrin 5A hydrolase/precorrin-3B C17-methyltransferase